MSLSIGALLLLGVAAPGSGAALAPPAGKSCSTHVGGAAGDGGFAGNGILKCDTDPGSGGSTGAASLPTRVTDCGTPQLVGHILSVPNDICGEVVNSCALVADPNAAIDPAVTTQAIEQQLPDGTWIVVQTLCHVTAANPQITPLLMSQEILKLVPHPTVGAAPPGGNTLVNIQTLFWLNTTADVPLAPLTLLGHHVTITAHVEQADWTFGDGTTDTARGPGKPYTTSDPCDTALCPHYYGHIYRSTGPVTVSGQVTWSGTYSVDGGAPIAIPGTVTGPAQTIALTVLQARGVLVDPNQPTR